MADLKLVVFDCDGVMFDSRDANRRYYNLLLARFGHPAMDAGELDFVHTHNVMDSVAHIFRRYPAAEIEAAHRFRHDLDYRPFLNHMIMEPDLKEFLQVLKPGYYTAISTNRTTTMPAILQMFGLAQYFDKVVTAMDVARPKPDAEALLQIMDHFKVTAAEGVFIGDSMVDREHAAAVGMELIAFKNPTLPAEYHVSRFMEILELPFFRKQPARGIARPAGCVAGVEG